MARMSAQKQLVEDLWSIRTVLTPKDNWTQGSDARDANGNACYPDMKEAVCWCFNGALELVGRAPVREAVLDAVWNTVGGSPISFNDGHTHRQVLAAIDKTIKRESALL
ncbi:MAG TPA: hypothetical protein VKQ30_20745 [Ktedonobacterales bacterium]|nr:hypothetical protein [Ktedonobacterales bacterium]